MPRNRKPAPEPNEHLRRWDLVVEIMNYLVMVRSSATSDKQRRIAMQAAMEGMEKLAAEVAGR